MPLPYTQSTNPDVVPFGSNPWLEPNVVIPKYGGFKVSFGLS